MSSKISENENEDNNYYTEQTEGEEEEDSQEESESQETSDQKEKEEKEEKEEEKEEEREERQPNNIKLNHQRKESESINENIFIISLELLKIFNQMHQTDSDSAIYHYLSETGLPMSFKTPKFLSLYLYFHKICSSFYSLFAKISSKEINKVILSLLKENYYLLADKEIKHYNYMDIAEKSYHNLALSEEKTDISKIPIILQKKISENSQDFQIQRFIIELGFQSHGRLDIYVKIHVLKVIIKYLNRDELLRYIQIFNQMEEDLMKVYENSIKEKLDSSKYEQLVNIFVDGEMQNNWSEYLNHCRKLLGIFQNLSDEKSIKILEKLFIQLLGHVNRQVRNYAVKMLNMIYDETTWQDKGAFPKQNTKIKLLDEKLILDLTIKKSDFAKKSIMLIVSSPSENENINYQCLTFLKAQNEIIENDHIKLIFNIGTLKKCGYYDWYLVRFSKGRFMNIKLINEKKEIIEGKGRTIVLNKDIKDLSVHEVFCDLINAEIDKDKGHIEKRGNFKNLENKLEEYQQRYINCLYVMGALERDNNIIYDEETGKPIDIGNDNASPMAVTSRSNISSLLGGDEAFISLMNKAHKLSIKIILDSLARISSSRAHRKYRNILLRYLDENGKTQICYGSDGKSVRYEDSAILNYRKIETWDLLVEEIKILIEKFNIDGVHLDNCQAWPQIMELDASEMYRIDIDGKPAYSPIDILNGEVVIPNTENGYWNTDSCEDYPNPFLIKLTKNIWNTFPEFIFFGECWLNEKYSQRHINLTKSGIIPRMYTLPIIICEILGKHIQRNGTIESIPPNNISIIKNWYKENYQDLPEGSLLIQSSSGQVWPYPALLFGRGNWSAVDLLFSLPDIPMTFMDEIDGEAYRVKITNVYESKYGNKNDKNNLNNGRKTRSKSLLKLIEAKEQEKREKEKENGQKKKLTSNLSSTNLGEFLPQYDLNENISSLINLSGIEIDNAREMEEKQQNLIKEIGPEVGFDLSKIKYHYNHRRKMRATHECMRRGKLIYLEALDNNGKPHPGVFAFARQTEEETGIFVINFREEETNFVLDLTPLLGKDMDYNTICYIEDWDKKNEKGEYFFLREMTQEHMSRKIGGNHSLSFGFGIAPFTEENYQKTMEKSNLKMLKEITKNEENKSVDNFQITIQLKDILNNKLPLGEFIKWMTYLTGLLDKSNVSLYDYVKKLDFISNDENLTTEFFRYCFMLSNAKGMNFLENDKSILLAEKIYQNNILGPICFITPELGRWSTIGGLGVMVDELSQGLASIGQEVLMISPYYNQNRRGASNYLSNDPFNIHYLKNITINLDSSYSFGVHYGVGNNINYYFLHNSKVFPRPYPDFGAGDTVREISCFAKACLQLLCDLNTIPAIIVTNDWFSGLVPAFAKNGSFGDVFKGTTFFHIIHNLEPTYEGRIYPGNHEGNLERIYQFDPNWLIDPHWRQRVINPSRCAIIMCDQWGTVSHSYKNHLLSASPLSHLLKQKNNPFSYPNGIFKEKRLKILNEKTGGNKKECKKYIQQKYFGYKDADYSVPIYSFIGRLTQQKGILLILDCVEELIRITGGKINILIGGMGERRDPYVSTCIGKINYFRNKYPYAFWANPDEFFTDGPKINLGSDFGLMPSLFEPGGIVQHEFFIAKTPVIAFRTGGLMDTVFEFRWDNNTGNGLTFDNYNCNDLLNAIKRSFELFKNKEKYEICQKNAFNSAIDVADVSRAWCKEFYRLKNKIFFNYKKVINTDLSNLKSLIHEYINNKNSINKNKYNSKENGGNYKNGNGYKNLSNDKNDNIMKSYEIEQKVPHVFSVKINDRPNSVLISGSFDKWQVKHPLSYNSLNNKWCITLNLKKGKHYFKYIIDGIWQINSNESSEQGKDGIINNYIII